MHARHLMAALNWRPGFSRRRPDRIIAKFFAFPAVIFVHTTGQKVGDKKEATTSAKNSLLHQRIDPDRIRSDFCAGETIVASVSESERRLRGRLGQDLGRLLAAESLEKKDRGCAALRWQLVARYSAASVHFARERMMIQLSGRRLFF